jgi:hypothetical protein
MLSAVFYRFAAPRTSFFTLRFADPRAYSRGLSGLSVFFFLRTVRLAFLRSSLVNALVFAMNAVIPLVWILASSRAAVVSFAPLGLKSFLFFPTAYAVGCIFSPRCG